jgi:hypothetical protein
MHLEDMLNKAQSSLNLVKKFYFITGLKLEDRARLFNGVIRPRFEYGLNIISKNNKLSKKIDSAMHKILCLLLRIGTNTSKLAIRRMLGIFSMEERRIILRNKLLKRIEGLQSINDTKNPAVDIFFDFYKGIILPGVFDKEIKKSRSQLKKMALEYSNGGVKLTITRDISWKQSGIINIPEPKNNGLITGVIKQNSRILLLFVLNRYPGVDTVCALCKRNTHNFRVHIKACSKISIETKQVFKPLDQISKIRWEDITIKKQLIDLLIKGNKLIREGKMFDQANRQQRQRTEGG